MTYLFSRVGYKQPTVVYDFYAEVEPPVWSTPEEDKVLISELPKIVSSNQTTQIIARMQDMCPEEAFKLLV